MSCQYILIKLRGFIESRSKIPGAYCINLLPEKSSGYFNRIFFPYGKVNGKNHANLSFNFTRVFLR